EDTVGLKPDGKKFVIEVVSAPVMSTITVMKGNKFTLKGADKKKYGYVDAEKNVITDRKALKPLKKQVAVSTKGVVSAKKATATEAAPRNGVILKYEVTAEGVTETKFIKVVVVDATAGITKNEEASYTIKKTTVTADEGNVVDVILKNLPDNALLQEVKNKKGVLTLPEGQETFAIVDKDGEWHIKCNAAKKGSVTISFKVNGKKVNYKIKVKKPKK
ncbi:MAG: hypothetical protein IKR68_07800, partial [Lachnospiraceae bacterium]|nr:hypothetical protein [Lachnospiraceae bacterium]